MMTAENIEYIRAGRNLHRHSHPSKIHSPSFPPCYTSAILPQTRHSLDCDQSNVCKKRHALSGHVVRLHTRVRARQALKQVIAMKSGRCSGMNWRRLPGLPRKTWIQQIGDGTTTSWKQMWQSAEERGHCGESSQRTTAVYAS